MKPKLTLAATLATLVVAGPAAAVHVPLTDGAASKARHTAAAHAKKSKKDERPRFVRYPVRH
jgi:hypothetical protein